MANGNNVTTNFGLLRWMNGTHKALVTRLGPTSTWNHISDYVIGHSVPDENIRHKIEAKLGLPKDWTSRDNLALIRVNADDYDLINKIVSLDSQIKKAVLAFCISLEEGK